MSLLSIRNFWFCFVASCLICRAQDTVELPGTQPLTLQGDLSAKMVSGIDTFLMRNIASSISERQKLWKRDFSSRAAYEKSVGENRAHLSRIIGASDPRVG